MSDLIYILGGSGRLGTDIVAMLASRKIECVALSRTDISSVRNLNKVITTPGVILDVSLPEGTSKLCASLHEEVLPFVKGIIIGATGHSPENMVSVYEASKVYPVVLVSNFSLGILFFETILTAKTVSGISIAELGRRLGFDLGIFEAHHVKKIDSPSGTAKALALAANVPLKNISSQRVGQVIGFHELMFSGDSEELKISHTAHSRAVFAKGAVTLAERMLAKKFSSGLLTMADILDF